MLMRMYISGVRAGWVTRLAASWFTIGFFYSWKHAMRSRTALLVKLVVYRAWDHDSYGLRIRKKHGLVSRLRLFLTSGIGHRAEHGRNHNWSATRPQTFLRVFSQETITYLPVLILEDLLQLLNLS